MVNRSGDRLTDLEAAWQDKARARQVDLAAQDPVVAAEGQLRQAEFERDLRLAERWLDLCPRRYRSADMDHLEQPGDVAAGLSAWLMDAKCGEADNLLLIGDLGIGKTYAALAAARELHFAGCRLHFSTVADLMAGLRARFDGLPGPDLVTLGRLDVVFLDDLGAEKRTEWTNEQLYMLFDARSRNEVPTVITSNLSGGQLRDWVGQRTYERVIEDARRLVFRGESRRKPKEVIGL